MLKAIIGLLLVAIAHAETSPYEVVNGRPRLASADSSFSFYFALWRGLTADLEKRLKPSGGNLISKRAIHWTTRDCQSDREISTDGETFWFLDSLSFDSEGKLIPILEARRPGYRYLGLVTLNAIFLRGLPFKKPLRISGESGHAFRAREGRLFDEWRAKAVPKGARGEINGEATHRVFAGGVATNGFVGLDAYRTPEAPLYSTYLKYRPDAWPVSYDERAHKPHRLDEPPDWARLDFLSENRFRFRLQWDWCGTDLKATLFVPPGELPPGGPTRPGRSNGEVEFQVIEDPGFTTR